MSPVKIHSKVAAIGPAQLLKRVEKSCDAILTLADPAYGFGTLRVPSQRPGSGNAADKRDEFAPSHALPTRNAPHHLAPACQADTISGAQATAVPALPKIALAADGN
jgi:hypothetical protein